MKLPRPNPRKYLTKSYWHLSTPPASIGYLFLWLADGANVGTMQQAGAIVSLGLSWREASAATAIGNIVIAAALTLNGAIGSRHHVPFSIASRASMGLYLSYFAVVSRLVLGLLHFGINTYIGASCMLIMLEAIWPSLKHYPNSIPAHIGITSNKMIAYFVFWTYLTRYAHKTSDAYWQLLFAPIVYLSFSFIGIVIASAGQSIYGKLYWDPTSIVALLPSRAASFFCAFAFGLATLGTNISTNCIASSNDFVFLAPRWLSIRRGALLTAVLCGWATCPWMIQASATSLTTFLSGYTIVLAPIIAIMVTDYYLVRHMHLHIPAPYQNEGIYRYRAGVNWRALVTLLVVVPIHLPGLIHAIDPKVDIGNYLYFYKALCFTSFFISASIYFVLSRLFPPTATLVEQAVGSLQGEGKHGVEEPSSDEQKVPESEKDADLDVFEGDAVNRV
ncbi:unnamed protein product [Peniophora sp. CBMAI 1063]|nr:unnamed protein product [Peniophora sp. CBMAI 1063]